MLFNFVVVLPLVIFLALCTDACFCAFGVSPTSSSQAGAVAASSVLNSSTYTTVYSVANTSDAASWDASSPTTTAPAFGVDAAFVIFGPGSDNTTSYVYGLVFSSNVEIGWIVKRTINNTIVSWANDTTEACVAATDQLIAANIVADKQIFGMETAVAPGYLAILTSGSDTGTPANLQLWVSLIGTSLTTTQITSTADITSTTQSISSGCTTTTSISPWSIWYDIGAEAFFYIYIEQVNTDAGAAANSACGGFLSSVSTIYLGGIYTNGTAYWSSPLAITPSVNDVNFAIGGGDNWLNSSNIYVVYKDSGAGVTYVSKTAKSTSTTSAGPFSTLIADSATGTFYPACVWASNYTWGITLLNGSTNSATYINFFNGSTTGTDSGFSYSSLNDGWNFYGWPLDTGYTLVGMWTNSHGLLYVIGTFYANGTVNSTQTTLASGIYEYTPLSFYEDVNGTMWIGWTDHDNSANVDQLGNPYTYAGYLAILQGQLNPAPSCNSPYFLYPNTGGQCLASCPAGYYGYSTTNTCQPCYSSGSGPTYYTCATCSAGAYNNCNSCNSGTFLTSSSCKSSCPAGYWGQTSDNTCQTCYSSGSSPYSCATCSAGANNNCNSCNSPYFLYPNTGGQCLASCPVGNYGYSTANTCQPCYSSGSSPYSCATCSAGADSSCNSCNSPYFLYPNTGGQCLASCPAGYYEYSTTHICQACYSSTSSPDYPCATCSGGAYNNCLTCNSGYFLSSSTCLNPCPAGYWGRTSDNTCQPCYNSGSSPYSCATCSAGANNSCNSCNSPYSLYPNTGGQCLASCPVGYYEYSTTHTCQPCYSSTSSPDYTCATCSAGASNNCLSCISGNFLYSNTCISPCPVGYWGDTSSNTCQHCYSSGSSPYSCTTCTGPNNHECNSCNSGTFLFAGQCLGSCSSGYWEDASTNTCQPCYSNATGPSYSCATCSAGGSQNCLSCNAGTFWDLTGGQCVPTCPMGYWGNSSTNACQICSSDSANISSCGSTTTSKVIFVIQISVTSYSTASVALSSTLQGSATGSGMFPLNLYLFLSAIESIANMQYFNLNHSQIALEAYSGLSSAWFPNWISELNVINKDQLVFNYGIFEKNQMSSLYLDNYGDSLVETVLYAVIYLAALILAVCKDKEKLLDSRTGKFYTIALGVFLSNLFGRIQSQVLFSILQLLKTNLFIDFYSRASYFLAYFAISLAMGLQILCFFRLKNIFAFKQSYKNNRDRSQEESSVQSNSSVVRDAKWTEKQFEMMFASFKEDGKHSFFFSFWMTAFNVAYILLIFALQRVPILQCLAIIILTILLIIFSAIIRPIKGKSSAFLYFFNLVSILLIGIINLAQAISNTLNPQDSNNDGFGMAIYYSIMVNNSVNLILGVSGILLGFNALLIKLKNRWKKSKGKVEKKIDLEPNIELESKIDLEKRHKSEVHSQLAWGQQSKSKTNHLIFVNTSNAKEMNSPKLEKGSQLVDLSPRGNVVIKEKMKGSSNVLGNPIRILN